MNLSVKTPKSNFFTFFFTGFPKEKKRKNEYAPKNLE